ncbi:plasmid mobilization protein [Bradyrhizobium sp. CCBAU 25338]|uniref:plasmid mobilization protein n=1 Tax=Bradyrhizobium sp. CCBAU 25338 TaxID=1641877 RepID=UPI002303B1C4|nr:hypothetical protein [Bradyrhizobium sp. CCBAU 25338]MDA9530039.1 hypothetical protein [Bradyrhizobium sp. CCBAU 25338]
MKKAKRSSVVRVRLTDEEHAAILAAATSAGLGICSYTRMVVVKAVGRTPAPAPRRPDEHAIALARWTGQLGKIGNSLNQLARDHNVGFDVWGLDVEEVRKELRELREAVLNFHRPESR